MEYACHRLPTDILRFFCRFDWWGRRLNFFARLSARRSAASDGQRFQQAFRQRRTLIAAIKYYRGGKVLILPALAAAAGAFPGAYLGAEALKAVSEEFARAFMLGAIPLAAIAVVLVKPSQSGAARFQGAKMLWLCFGIGCICGAYDGFFGPGTGTIYIALFTGLTGMEMVTASGSAKIANLSSNLAALVSMMLSGDVCFPLAIPAMVFSIAGGYLGAKFAIKRGAKAVRVVMLLVLAGILAKLVFQL